MPWLYDDPSTMDYNNVDEAIRNLCRLINSSTWLRTEESCAGHPSKEPSAWDNKDLYFRLVVLKSADIARLLMMMDKIRAGCNWPCHLSYDRHDELGSHWFFTLSYDKEIRYRDLAIDFVLGKFKES